MAKSTVKFNRYHRDVYFPENHPEMVLEFVNLFTEEVDLTTHAAEKMIDDTNPRGRIPLPTNEQLFHNSNELIEFYERVDIPGQIQKVVMRIRHLSEKYDYTYVVSRDGFIITCWSNSKTDNHRLTESINLYYCPPELRSEIYEKLSNRAKTYEKIDDK